MHTSWTTPQSDNRALLFLDNNGLSWTVSAPDKVTAVPVRRNGNSQTPISLPAVRPKRCHTLSNPAHRQDYTVACLNYTLQTMMPLPGWPVMAAKCILQQHFDGYLIRAGFSLSRALINKNVGGPHLGWHLAVSPYFSWKKKRATFFSHHRLSAVSSAVSPIYFLPKN